METAIEKNIEVSQFNEFKIEKDFDRYTVRITRPSKRARLGYKTICYYSFKRTDISASIMRMNMFVDQFIQDETKKIAAKEAKKAALKDARKNFECPFTVGQILYDSWGYEQTNVNFYQITKIEGKAVFVREVAQDRTETGFMSGTTMPIANEFVGEEVKKIVQIRVWNDKTHVSLKSLSTWDGRSKHWSAYA